MQRKCEPLLVYCERVVLVQAFKIGEKERVRKGAESIMVNDDSNNSSIYMQINK